jgi:hypothetical protein
MTILTQIRNGWLRFRFRQVVLEMLISVCLASLVWMYIHSRARHTIERVCIPVQVQLAAHQQEEFVLEASESRSVTASFSGPNSRIREVRRRLQRGKLQAVATLTIPPERKNEAMFREMVRIDEDSVTAPAGVKVEISEENLPVTVHRLAERTLPVQLECTGEAHVSKIAIEPSAVRVRGPKVVLDRASVLPTQPYAVRVNGDLLPAAEANVRDQVALVSELEGRPIQTELNLVKFRCRAVPLQRTYQLSNVPVRFLCPKDCPWRPRFEHEQAGKVALKLIGPVTEQPPPVVAFVDLTTGNLTRGKNFLPVRLQLPKDFQLVEPTTVWAWCYLEEIDRPALTGQKPMTE